MRAFYNTLLHGIGALLICIGFIFYVGIAEFDVVANAMRLAVCAIATMGTGVLLLWWRV